MHVAVVKKPSIFREGLIQILTKEFPYETIVGLDPMNFINTQNPNDGFVIDIDENPSIVEEVKEMRGHYKDILIWTSKTEHPYLKTLFAQDLLGYLHAEMTQAEFKKAMHQTLKGKPFIYEKFSHYSLHCYQEEKNKITKPPSNVFTNREWEVMALLMKGCNNQQISQSLCVTEKTVKNNISSILRKLKVPDRTNAVITALKNKWFILT